MKTRVCFKYFVNDCRLNLFMKKSNSAEIQKQNLIIMWNENMSTIGLLKLVEVPKNVKTTINCKNYHKIQQW